ncbi:hypothetical protein BV20DRAFT_961476 [Pilatotrama ljubarskyi]|nr:hypothetical protein BV20DRAFT_961476 [Pilatotrama ljubarskyi]
MRHLFLIISAFLASFFHPSVLSIASARSKEPEHFALLAPSRVRIVSSKRNQLLCGPNERKDVEQPRWVYRTLEGQTNVSGEKQRDGAKGQV